MRERSTRRLGSRLEALGGTAATRGARFLLRSGGSDVPGLAALALVPAWQGWPSARRARLGTTAALLRHRAALNRELSAARLAPLAALVGEELFDAVCQATDPEMASSGSGLPSPAALTAQGQELLSRALPPVLGGAGEPAAVRLVQHAADLVEGHSAA